MLSIIHFGNINSDTTNILMMTSQEFKLIVEKLNAKFHIIEANSLYEVCYSRLRIFEYDKILFIYSDKLFVE